MIAVAVALTWRNSLSLKDAAFGAQVAAFPSAGFAQRGNPAACFARRVKRAKQEYISFRNTEIMI